MGKFTAVGEDNVEEFAFARKLADLCQEYDPIIDVNNVVSILFSVAILRCTQTVGVENTQHILRDMVENVQILHENNERLAKLAEAETRGAS